ncbi:DUF1697 domain-containing protein [Microbacterium sp. XT11]|uniref:DUF1697 domain-containing protein n=1 Tax=Microbacterium sp. XT11 TaxID=367477 RepID=UPI000742E73D|nr:DUF1697 domain-containing protein [Microbacterium sp. XT11]ALX67449.1 hypothetical protein AB663_003401 [Microbacterium sp. XT11]
MTRSVLLLRAVAVNGRNSVPMARLCVLLEPRLGEVSTYIASGNIICADPDDPDTTCAEVRALIAAEFGVDTPVIHRTHGELVSSIAAQPFEGEVEKLLHAMFLERQPPAGVVDGLRERLVPGERIALVGKDLWIDYAADGVHGTKLTTPVLDRALGVSGTARNLRTVRRLIELTA